MYELLYGPHVGVRLVLVLRKVVYERLYAVERVLHVPLGQPPWPFRVYGVLRDVIGVMGRRPGEPV